MSNPDPVQAGATNQVIDIIAHYRERVFYSLSIMVAILLLPLAIDSLLSGRLIIAFFNLLVILILTVDAVYMYFRRKFPIAPSLAFIALILNISVTMLELDLIGILWIFPTTVLTFFVLTRKLANALSALSILLITSLAYYSSQPIQETSIVIASMLLTILFANIIVKTIVDLQNKLRDISIIDELTGAYNRRHLNDSLETALARLKRYDNNISLILLDIDHFKRINDTLGHSAGDRVLKNIVNIIWSSLRSIDMVFRYGGEEFIVLLPETTRDNALQVAEKLRSMIQDIHIIDHRHVTISAGIAQIRAKETIDDLLKRVDDALYKAKNSGRNRVCMAEETQ